MEQIISDRRLPLQGCYNFRDIGGYRADSGRYVKWGKIFRSDELSSITQSDLDFLSNIPLLSMVDFRSAQAAAQQPDKIPQSVKNTYSYSILPGDLMKFADKGIPSLDETYVLMQQMYRDLVVDQDAVAQFRKLFTLLQADSNVPLVYHCSAGKDRTGMATALILISLGVDTSTVIDDYLLSNQYLKGKYDAYIKQYPALEPLLDVNERYLNAGLEQIVKTYGSTDNFIRNILDVNTQLMKDKYLYRE